MVHTPVSIPESAFCRACGYDLHGLDKPRCPECGRAFDPDDRRSYDRSRNGGTAAADPDLDVCRPISDELFVLDVGRRVPNCQSSRATSLGCLRRLRPDRTICAWLALTYDGLDHLRSRMDVLAVRCHPNPDQAAPLCLAFAAWIDLVFLRIYFGRLCGNSLRLRTSGARSAERRFQIRTLPDSCA